MSLRIDQESGRVIRDFSRVCEVPRGHAFDALVVLFEAGGVIVSYADLARRIGIGGASRQRLANIIYKLREAIFDKEGRLLVNVPNEGYRLDNADTRPDRTADPLQEGRYLGPYATMLHEVKRIIEGSLDLTASMATRLHWNLAQRIPSGMQAEVDCSVLSPDLYRVALKREFDHLTDLAVAGSSTTDGRTALVERPFEAFSPIVMRLRAGSADDCRRLIDDLQRIGAVVTRHPECDCWRLELPVTPHELNLGELPTAQLRSIRVEVSTFAAHERWRGGGMAAGSVRDSDPVDEDHLCRYARDELGAAALNGDLGPGVENHDPRRVKVQWIWIAQMVSSARFAGLSTIADIRRTVDEGWDLMREYQQDTDGRRTFAPGDVTDVLSKALIFSGNERIAATYPLLPQTRLFRLTRK